MSDKLQKHQDSELTCAIITPIGPNHEHLAKECTQSVQQSVKNSKGPFLRIEHIFVDDRTGNLGPSAARNIGVEKAKMKQASWIVYLDADDIFLPDAFETIKTYISQYDAIWGQICVFNWGDKGNYQLNKLPNQLPFTNDIKDVLFTNPSLSICVGHFLKIQVATETLFNPELNSGEDFDHFLRVWTRYKCVKISHPLCGKRINMQKLSNSQSERKIARESILRQFKIKSINFPQKSTSSKKNREHMNVAIFGMMRSGTTILNDMLSVKGKSLILNEPHIHLGFESLNIVIVQLKKFGFDISIDNMASHAKQYSTARQFFDAEILPLVSGLDIWGAKITDLSDWEGFMSIYKPRRLILCVRDIRDVVISLFDLALRLNRLTVDEYWIESKVVTSCQAILMMARKYPHLLVRYEDICSDACALERSAKYIGLDKHSNEIWYQNVIPFRQFEFEKHGTEISKKSLFRYRSEPPGPVLELAKRVWRKCPQYSETFGYEAPRTEVAVSELNDDREGEFEQDHMDLSCLLPFDPAIGRREARKAIASLIPNGSIVLDLSCGTMSLEPMLSENCKYIPCDVVKRYDRIIVCDFNRIGKLPLKHEATIIVVIGLIEYINDVMSFLIALKNYRLPVFLSYHPLEAISKPNRIELGWSSHLSVSAMKKALYDTGFSINVEDEIYKNQILLGISSIS